MIKSKPGHRRILCLLLVGCATAIFVGACTSTGLVRTSYDAGVNQTEYETDPISIPGMSWGGGYGGSKSLEVRAEADCTGQTCKPDRVRLIFQVSGSGSMRIENRSVQLTANGQTFGSARQRRDVRDATEEASALGVIATMEMPFSDFRTIAEAEEVTGSVGTSTFSLQYSKRGPFQALVRQATGTGDQDEGS